MHWAWPALEAGPTFLREGGSAPAFQFCSARWKGESRDSRTRVGGKQPPRLYQIQLARLWARRKIEKPQSLPAFQRAVHPQATDFL